MAELISTSPRGKASGRSASGHIPRFSCRSWKKEDKESTENTRTSIIGDCNPNQTRRRKEASSEFSGRDPSGKRHGFPFTAHAPGPVVLEEAKERLARTARAKRTTARGNLPQMPRRNVSLTMPVIDPGRRRRGEVSGFRAASREDLRGQKHLGVPAKETSAPGMVTAVATGAVEQRGRGTIQACVLTAQEVVSEKKRRRRNDDGGLWLLWSEHRGRRTQDV
ncbi:predicted protein [Uncinocarpus reesii 1704]|uniref:Uncharacterized protein n=1 Tax=Uncinocarpus reesii (strain UAMH 1704) TaxID=336963 RepID=C4JZP9_UNCRE|nr:uncharacterized protein UREG_07650 [Uncinocarpus reesii 1704]EEP82785.1 predicted protein [Uncinocarpus reesii 1704]